MEQRQTPTRSTGWFHAVVTNTAPGGLQGQLRGCHVARLDDGKLFILEGSRNKAAGAHMMVLLDPSLVYLASAGNHPYDVARTWRVAKGDEIPASEDAAFKRSLPLEDSMHMMHAVVVHVSDTRNWPDYLCKNHAAQLDGGKVVVLGGDSNQTTASRSGQLETGSHVMVDANSFSMEGGCRIAANWRRANPEEIPQSPSTG